MGVHRKHYSKETKFKASLALISGQHTLTELCQKYEVHQSVLQRWKRDLEERGPDLFDNQKKPQTPIQQVDVLERKVGQLTMEVDFLKKVLGK
jgi:transposase